MLGLLDPGDVERDRSWVAGNLDDIQRSLHFQGARASTPDVNAIFVG